MNTIILFAGSCLFFLLCFSLYLRCSKHLKQQRKNKEPLIVATSPVVVLACPTFIKKKVIGGEVIIFEPKSSKELQQLNKDWNSDRNNRTTYLKRLQAIKHVERKVYKTLSLQEWEELIFIKNEQAELCLLLGFYTSPKVLTDDDFYKELGPDHLKSKRKKYSLRIDEIVCRKEILAVYS